MQFRHASQTIFALSLAASAAMADDRAACETAGGTYLTGIVVSEPRLVEGHDRHGIDLSHTKFFIRSDLDHDLYAVAADNVFAAGYDRSGAGVPAPLDAIHKDTRLELCGALFAHGRGIHWVHTNCGAPISPREPDGWIRVVGPDGRVGGNLESNTEYCSLWRRRSR